MTEPRKFTGSTEDDHWCFFVQARDDHVCIGSAVSGFYTCKMNKGDCSKCLYRREC